MLLIEHFTSGSLPGLQGGESLRATLAECLMCTPMRVTKKLSATHAIGKCCFKKQGELPERQREELAEARKEFLASVEPRTRPSAGVPGPPCDRVTRGSSTRERKRSRDGEDAPPRARWVEPRDAGPTVAPHELPPTPTVEPSVHSFVNARRRTAVRMVVADRPGILGEMARFFTRRGLTIVACRCETLAGGVAHDEFEVVDEKTRLPVEAPAALAALEAAALVSLRRHERQSGEATTLSVAVPDRPGLLKTITQSLTNLSLSVVGARISTKSENARKTAVDTFDVVDAVSGGPVLDPARLRAIEAELQKALSEDPSLLDERPRTDSAASDSSPSLPNPTSAPPSRQGSITASADNSPHGSPALGALRKSPLPDDGALPQLPTPPPFPAPLSPFPLPLGEEPMSPRE